MRHAHNHERGCGPRGLFFMTRGHGRHGFGRGFMSEGFGEGGGRRRVFDSGELRLVLLKLISDQPRHGYDLIRAIEELTGGAYAPSPGVVYPTLTLLQDMGHIDEQKSEGARKAFAATAEGVAHLAASKAEVDAMIAFYGSVEGASILRKAPQAMSLTMQEMQPLMQGLMEDIKADIDKEATARKD